jgi:hypothetical protein
MADIKFGQITTPGGYQPGSDIGSATGAVERLISNTLVVLTATASIGFVLFFLLGGLNWITAGGDKGKIDKAKGMMTNGAVGLIVITVSYSITWIVGQALGIDILEPGKMINSLKFK